MLQPGPVEDNHPVDFVERRLGDATVGLSQHGDGMEFQVSGIMGADFDDGRGNVSFAMSMNKREASYQKNRKWYRDLWTDPQVGGDQFFIEYPGVVLDASNMASTAGFQAAIPGSNPIFIGSGPNDITTLFGVTLYTQPNHNDQAFTWGFFNNLQQGGLANFHGFEDEPLRYHRQANNGAAANFASRLDLLRAW